jgi:uncharacterized protein YecT (DUF1311 family)
VGQGQSDQQLLRSLSSAAIVLFLLEGFPCQIAQGQTRDVRHCLAIQNVDERVECMEGRAYGSSPDAASQSSAPSRASPGPMSSPSVDCASASTRVERAICGDALLADWDRRMGQLFQQIAGFHPADRATLLAGQRSWIDQRNRTCGSLPEEAFKGCITSLTRARVAELATLANDAGRDTTTSQQPPAFTTSPRGEGDPLPITAPSVSSNSAPSLTPPQQPARASPTAPPQQTSQSVPNSPAQRVDPAQSRMPSEQSGAFGLIFVVLIVLGGIWFFVAFMKRVRRRQQEILQREQFVAQLVARYGDVDAKRILEHEIWLGMTQEQLELSWGNPADKNEDVLKTKIRETWKYGQTGKNRFLRRVILENGVVVRWQQ